MIQNRTGDDLANFAIELASLCEATHSLPGPGGVLQQDVLHIKWLNAGLAAIAEKRRLDARPK